MCMCKCIVNIVIACSIYDIRIVAKNIAMRWYTGVSLQGYCQCPPKLPHPQPHGHQSPPISQSYPTTPTLDFKTAPFFAQVRERQANAHSPGNSSQTAHVCLVLTQLSQHKERNCSGVYTHPQSFIPNQTNLHPPSSSHKHLALTPPLSHQHPPPKYYCTPLPSVSVVTNSRDFVILI